MKVADPLNHHDGIGKRYQKTVRKGTPRLGFEPRSKAPEASRISTTLPGPELYSFGWEGVKKFGQVKFVFGARLGRTGIILG